MPEYYPYLSDKLLTVTYELNDLIGIDKYG